MSWNVNDQEFQSVLSLPADERYDYFIKRAAARGELRGLRDEDGWVVSQDDEDRKHLPLWAHPRFAEACAAGPWARAQPESIDVDEWVIGWSENLERDGLTVVVFQTPDDEGVSASPARVKADLSRELARFGP